MVEILSAVVPIFVVVATGYGCTRFGLFARVDMAILSRFVVKVALPLLVFVNVSGRSAAEIFNPTYLLTYALAALVMYALAAGYARVAGRAATRGAAMGMLMGGTNNGFIGFPMFLILLPEFAGAAVGMDMLVDNTLIIPLGLLLLERSASREGAVWQRVATTLRNVVTHPMVVAIIVALVLNALGVTLPEIVSRGVGLLAQASSGTALFAVGGMLVGLRLTGMITDIVVSVVGKLLVMPAVGLGLVLGLVALGLPDLPGPLRAAAVITCALPTFSIVPALVASYGEEEVASAAMMTQVVLSFFTLTGWLFVVQGLGWL